MERDLKIDADGGRMVIEPFNDEYYTKQELQAYVEGSIMIFRLDNGDYMFANPDGDSLRLPFNGDGTIILIEHGYPKYNARGTIVLADASRVDLTKLLDNVTVAQ